LSVVRSPHYLSTFWSISSRFSVFTVSPFSSSLLLFCYILIICILPVYYLSIALAWVHIVPILLCLCHLYIPSSKRHLYHLTFPQYFTYEWAWSHHVTPTHL
jgi:hypothetical protein